MARIRGALRAGLWGILVLASIGCVAQAVKQLPASAYALGPYGLPAWAYHVIDEPQPETITMKGPVRLPGSTREYDASTTAGMRNPPDWYPEEHPPAPPAVAGGPGGPSMACGSCHMMNGLGHPENADLAGLPVGYFVRQMQYFKSGARKEAARMNELAPTLSDKEVLEAAEYFSKLKPRASLKVIETGTVPRTYISVHGRMRMPHPAGGTEPLGRRILQMPENVWRTMNRDPHSIYLAYVPRGSVARGKRLVTTGASGKTLACAQCHGEGLHGLGEIPRIAGLQPVYTARQLIGIQNGASAGAGVEPMKAVVAKLTEDDIIAISAYLGTLPPS